MWGVIWMIGYAATWLRPAWWPVWPVWPVLAMAGVSLSIWMGRRGGGARAAYDWRPITTSVAVTAFIVAVFAVMQPRGGAQFGAFIPILVALAYALVGIWARAPRMLVTGIVVGALTVGGYFWLQLLFAVDGGSRRRSPYCRRPVAANRVMDQPDAIIHQPVRLKIMAALNVLPEGERLEFV